MGKPDETLDVLENISSYIEAAGEKETVNAIRRKYEVWKVEDCRKSYSEGRKFQAYVDDLIYKIGGAILALVTISVLCWAVPTYNRYDHSKWLERLSACENGYTVGCLDAVKVERTFTYSEDATKREIFVLRQAYKEKTGKELSEIP